MTIETERLILRNFTPDDLDEYHKQIYSDPDVTRYLPGGKPRPIDRTKVVLDYSMDHAQKHGFTFWAVETKANHQLIGHCGLVYLQEVPEVEVAYAFGKAYWGQGYATEGAAASLRYGFETAELDHILALAEVENMASQRVMQKIGMKHEGMTEQFYNHKLALYRLNREDWMPDTGFYRFEKSVS